MSLSISTKSLDKPKLLLKETATYILSFSLACRCRDAAATKHYDYFSISFWGECWGGSDEKTVTQLLRNRKQVQGKCKTRKFMACNDMDKYECTGKVNFEYVYKLKYNSWMWIIYFLEIQYSWIEIFSRLSRLLL